MEQQGPLRAFCVACARFTAGDGLGELLAVAAAGPYFAIYHVAVLLHARRWARHRRRSAAGYRQPVPHPHAAQVSAGSFTWPSCSWDCW